MPESKTSLPPNYWRESLIRFRNQQEDILKIPHTDHSILDTLTEERAKLTLELLESLQVQIDNMSPQELLALRELGKGTHNPS